MFSRRDVLASSAAVLASAAFPARAATPADSGKALNALFDQFFAESLRRNPESATQLGLDKGEFADLHSKLADNSAAGIAASKALNADQLKRLKAFNPSGLSVSDRLNYDTVLYTKESQARLAKFDFGSGSSPYVISQQAGAYQDVPDFLDTKHRIENAADADAYLARLDAFAGQIDNDIERMNHDVAKGVAPPDFLLDRSLEQMRATRAPADRNVLVQSIERRAKEKNLDAHYAADARKIYDGKIGPALDRLIAATEAVRAHATHVAGVWRFKDGGAFYAAALHSATTTNMSPQAVHKLGLEQAAEISARLDETLKKQGFTQGTVSARMTALTKDPKYLYPNTDAGKAEAIAYCNERLDAIRPKLPTAFKRLPNYIFEVRRVPPATEPGAASAFSQGPALDGSRPGIVYFNLHDSAEWPKFTLPSVVYHEGLPGHQLEGGLALGNANLPLIRKTTGFSGYAEGWGLYAEQLADEMGMYEDDPLGRLGYLKFQMFRAGRCVVDTGIHHFGWSREKAIQYFIDLDGDAPGFAAREVERYCTNPGQACSYKIGHTVFVTGRENAKAALGPRYDIKNYHDAVLDCGRVPLDILSEVIDRYIASARA